MPTEKYRTTRIPLAVRVILDLIHGYAAADAPETKLEKAFEKSLLKLDPDRESAKKIVKPFASISPKIKTPIFRCPYNIVSAMPYCMR